MPCRVASRKAYKQRKRAAARTQWAEHAEPGKAHPIETPPGYHIRGQTVQAKIGPDGQPLVTQVWSRSWEDSQQKRLEALVEAMTELGETKVAREPLIRPPLWVDKNHMTVIPLGDPHVGMYAWGPETGEDFDLEIAERVMLQTADALISRTPPSEVCAVINLGDFFHADNFENRTLRAGHALDVDTRWSQVFAVGVRIIIRILDRALESHHTVVARMVSGNHDDVSSVALGHLLAAHYRDNHRITIALSPNPFWYHRFGRVLIGATHGHGPKIADLPQIMAHDCQEFWSETRHRHWYTGHIHQTRWIETPIGTVEVARTTAPRDAWAHAKGYRAGRDMRAHVWHSERGLLETLIEPVDL